MSWSAAGVLITFKDVTNPGSDGLCSVRAYIDDALIPRRPIASYLVHGTSFMADSIFVVSVNGVMFMRQA